MLLANVFFNSWQKVKQSPVSSPTKRKPPLNLSITGGTVSSTSSYSVTWSNGATTEDLINIGPGVYFVTVVDDNNCQITGQWEVNRFDPLDVTVTTETIADCDTRELYQVFTASTTGGIPDYTYLWSSGEVSGVNGEIMTATQNGTVTLTVTDSIGCIANYSFNVDLPEIGEVNFDRFIKGVEYDNRELSKMENAVAEDSFFRKDYVSRALHKKTRAAYSQIKDNLEGASFLYLAALFDRIPHQLKLEEGEFDIPNNTSAMIVLGKGHITGRNGQTRPIMVSITYELFNEKALQTDEVVVTASRLKLANPYKTIGYVSEMITDIQKI